MNFELDLQVPNQDDPPWKHGLVTFCSFIFFGLFPLLGYAILYSAAINEQDLFIISCNVSALMFFILGAIKTKFSQKIWYYGGLEILVMGSCTAAVAFLVGFLVEGIISAGWTKLRSAHVPLPRKDCEQSHSIDSGRRRWWSKAIRANADADASSAAAYRATEPIRHKDYDHGSNSTPFLLFYQTKKKYCFVNWFFLFYLNWFTLLEEALFFFCTLTQACSRSQLIVQAKHTHTKKKQNIRALAYNQPTLSLQEKFTESVFS